MPIRPLLAIFLLGAVSRGALPPPGPNHLPRSHDAFVMSVQAFEGCAMVMNTPSKSGTSVATVAETVHVLPAPIAEIYKASKQTMRKSGARELFQGAWICYRLEFLPRGGSFQFGGSLKFSSQIKTPDTDLIADKEVPLVLKSVRNLPFVWNAYDGRIVKLDRAAPDTATSYEFVFRDEYFRTLQLHIVVPYVTIPNEQPIVWLPTYYDRLTGILAMSDSIYLNLGQTEWARPYYMEANVDYIAQHSRTTGKFTFLGKGVATTAGTPNNRWNTVRERLLVDTRPEEHQALTLVELRAKAEAAVLAVLGCDTSDLVGPAAEKFVALVDGLCAVPRSSLDLEVLKQGAIGWMAGLRGVPARLDGLGQIVVNFDQQYLSVCGRRVATVGTIPP